MKDNSQTRRPQPLSRNVQKLELLKILGWTEGKHNSLFPGSILVEKPGASIELSAHPAQYLKSLDEIHELEKTLFNGHPELWERYLGEELPKVCGEENAPECADPEQRVEAILRTLDRWDALIAAKQAR